MTAVVSPPGEVQTPVEERPRRGLRRAKASARPERAPRPRRQPRPIRPGEPDEAWSFASSAMTVLAVVCGWMLLQLLVLGGLSEQRDQHLLYAQFRGELSAATAPTGALDYLGHPLEPGAPVALLTVGGATQVVVSGTASGDLLAGPGHVRTTPLPGQQGISVVMGRASTYGAPFADIGDLPVGSTITVQNAQGTVDYTVHDIRRAGDPIPAAPTGTQGRLTLISAEGSGFLSALSPRNAVYVDALTDKAEPAGVVASGPLPAAEAPMARDTRALPSLVLLLAALLALVWGATVACRRFRVALVWVFAIPCAVALAWAVTDQVMRLLPNLM